MAATRRALIPALLTVVLLGVPACGDDDDRVESGAGKSSTTTTSEPDVTDDDERPGSISSTSSTPSEPAGTTPPTTGELDQRPQPSVSVAPAFDGECASVEAASPDRLAVEVCQIGRSESSVSIRVTGSDGDAVVRDDCGSPTVEWGDGPTPVCQIGCVAESTEPKPLDRAFTHDYADAGTHHLTVAVESHCGQSPRGERVVVELDVVSGS